MKKESKAKCVTHSSPVYHGDSSYQQEGETWIEQKWRAKKQQKKKKKRKNHKRPHNQGKCTATREQRRKKVQREQVKEGNKRPTFSHEQTLWSSSFSTKLNRYVINEMKRNVVLRREGRRAYLNYLVSSLPSFFPFPSLCFLCLNRGTTWWVPTVRRLVFECWR